MNFKFFPAASLALSAIAFLGTTAQSHAQLADLVGETTHSYYQSPGWPDVQPVPRADLVPYTFTPTFIANHTYNREYDFSLVIENRGVKPADDVIALIGIKVLSTTDPVNYPVGKKFYAGWGQMTEPCVGYNISFLDNGSFFIPLGITRCEVYVVLDRPIESFDDHWENDTGAALRGDILEYDDLNNVSRPYPFNFTLQPYKAPQATLVR